MSADYQVLSFQDIAPVRRVGIYGTSPFSLDIQGTSFVGVDTVLVNGVASPEFLVATPRQIIAQVPDSELSAEIRTVKVLLSKKGLTDTTAIVARAVVSGERAEGFVRLLQTFLRLLLTSPGEDFQNPALGGGLFLLVGTSGEAGDLRARAAQAIRTTESQLISLQAKNPSLASSERLRSAALVQASFDGVSTSISLRIRLTAIDGTTGSPLVSV